MNDALFGLGIEEMDVIDVESDGDGVACMCDRLRGNTRDNVGLLAESEIEIGLCAHELGELDVAGDVAVNELVEIDLLVVEQLGTHTCDDLLVVVGSERLVADLVLELELGNLELDVLEAEINVAVGLLFEIAGDEVHLRSAYEAGNEGVAGLVIKVLRSVDLLDDAVLHNDDARCHGHSLDLVMRNVDEGGLELLMKLGELGSHRCTQFSIEVGERLVEQEDLRLTDYCTAESDTLLLTTGKSLGLTVEQVSDVEYTSSFFNAALDLFFADLAQLEAECHVIKHGHMRIKFGALFHTVPSHTFLLQAPDILPPHPPIP